MKELKKYLKDRCNHQRWASKQTFIKIRQRTAEIHDTGNWKMIL